jgi:hypothetical protein
MDRMKINGAEEEAHHVRALNEAIFFKIIRFNYLTAGLSHVFKKFQKCDSVGMQQTDRTGAGRSDGSRPIAGPVVADQGHSTP